MKNELLKLLGSNARYTVEQLAVMMASTPEAVAAEIDTLEKEGVICGYKTVIDWEKVDATSVSAIIELNVVPKADLGFEEVAEKVASYPEVEAVYLMSGGYDLNVVVKGKNLQEVSRFVARELATIDSVTSTATHFVMRRYKEMDVKLIESEKDDRGTYLL
ncbi:MAG: Lrp/AsnC family transcriptional regulator [Ruminococcaceae bacterium]|nr:Lrp/AsnC family transcriptional regulator [Oscillospiraceae bacterium]